MSKQYADRDLLALDKNGAHYTKHMHVADMAISTLKLGFKHLPIEKKGAFTQAIRDLEAFAKTPSVNAELLEALQDIGMRYGLTEVARATIAKATQGETK